MLTAEEIIEFEALLKGRQIYNSKQLLINPNEKSNKNYLFLHSAIVNRNYNEKGELISGYRGCALEGSSRSGKTWSGVDIIIWLCLFVEKSCTINIYRETYNEFKTTLYEDFKRRLDDYFLPNPFHNAKEIKSFKIGRSNVFFLGDGKHGGGCDYAFFNEVMFINQSVFDQSEMRCRKFWWADYNPSFTEHWFFNSVLKRPDVGFLRTTFNDNPHITNAERNKILGYNPFALDSYIIKNDELHCYNKLTNRVEPISETNRPMPHPTNVDNGTANLFNHKVYALGLRGAMEGVIFDYIEWIDEFPDMGHIYTNDFGFTTDPNVLTRYAEDNYNIWIECLSYAPIETSEELSGYMEALGLDRKTPMICDSADKYTGGNNGAVEMVRDMRKRGWEVMKVSKTKSIMFWLNSMKRKKIHVVRNGFYEQVKKEKENYIMKKVNGISINQPIDKFNNFWDSARYGHIAYNKNLNTYSTTKTLAELGIIY